jgi:hypothetical protein
MRNGCATIFDSPQAGQSSLKQRPNTFLICGMSTFKISAHSNVLMAKQKGPRLTGVIRRHKKHKELPCTPLPDHVSLLCLFETCFRLKKTDASSNRTRFSWCQRRRGTPSVVSIATMENAFGRGVSRYLARFRLRFELAAHFKGRMAPRLYAFNRLCLLGWSGNGHRVAGLEVAKLPRIWCCFCIAHAA